MVTIYTQGNRQPAFRDVDGIETIVKANDSVETFTIDWSDQLDPAETISIASASGNGVAVGGPTISGQTTYATVAGTNGEAKFTIMTSLSCTFVKTLRFIDSGDAS